MEAQLVRTLPEGDGWQYEPKWDGFRGVLENDGGELALWSRNERPLLRYFPELRPLGDLLPPHSALDGEIVIARDGALDFDSMQMRLHPAESRVRKLSAEIPAEFVVFDVLLWDGEPVWKQPLEERRERVDALDGLSRVAVHARRSRTRARWLDRFESMGLDGVVAKKLGVPYLPGLARRRREDQGGEDGRLRRRRAALEDATSGRSRRCCSASTATTAASTTSARARSRRATHDEIAAQVLPLLEDAPERRFSEPNRWGTGELEEAPVRQELVVEVRYDKVQGNRFRHGTKLLRFRDDKDPKDCTWRELRHRRATAGRARTSKRLRR